MPAQALFIVILIGVAILAAIAQTVILDGFTLRQLVALTIAYTVLLVVPPLIKKWLDKR